MADYIINPTVFYWADVFNILKSISTYVTIFGLLMAIGFVIAFFYNKSQMDDYDEKDCYYTKYNGYMSLCKTWIIALSIVSALSTLCVIFVPNKQTVLCMLIARTITKSNVDWTVQQIKEVVDYIMNAMRSVM